MSGKAKGRYQMSGKAKTAGSLQLAIKIENKRTDGIFCRMRIGFQAVNCSCSSIGFVWRESLKSSNSLRIGPRPKMISYGFLLSKTEKSYGSSNAFQSKAPSVLSVERKKYSGKWKVERAKKKTEMPLIECFCICCFLPTAYCLLITCLKARPF